MNYNAETREYIKCFADAEEHCTALKDKDCYECGFYKPKRNLELERLRALLRIKSLDEVTRKHIAEKYGVKGIM